MRSRAKCIAYKAGQDLRPPHLMMGLDNNHVGRRPSQPAALLEYSA